MNLSCGIVSSIRKKISAVTNLVLMCKIEKGELQMEAYGLILKYCTTVITSWKYKYLYIYN